LKYLLIILAVISIVALYLTGRVPQDVDYHQFADTDVLFGIPHFHNVLSNLPFLFIGLMGISFMKRNDYTTLMFEKIIYSTVFLGLILQAADDDDILITLFNNCLGLC
jgi:hypothetical protein